MSRGGNAAAWLVLFACGLLLACAVAWCVEVGAPALNKWAESHATQEAGR